MDDKSKQQYVKCDVGSSIEVWQDYSKVPAVSTDCDEEIVRAFDVDNESVLGDVTSPNSD